MRRLVERYGPRSPRGRAIAAAVSGAVGGFALFMHLIHLMAIQYEFTDQVAPVLTLVVGAAGVALAYFYACSVVRRAESAPEPDWWSADESAGTETKSTVEEDPIDILQRRYAEGELTTEEFEERVARLVERDEVTREAADGLVDLDRELERA